MAERNGFTFYVIEATPKGYGDKVKKEEEYRVYMAVKAFEYTVRSNDSELLIGVQ